jgi:CheY-like chemotaxis protein
VDDRLRHDFLLFGGLGGWAGQELFGRPGNLRFAQRIIIKYAKNELWAGSVLTRKLFSLYSFGDRRMSDSPAVTPSKRKVLVADDEQVIANTLAIILNQAGFEARAVYSGEKAIESLDSFQPDMLISDVIMTGMTGIEAAIATREKMPNCKILLFSGQAATADLLEKARQNGHEFEILAKPVHPTDLLAKLRG